MFSRIPTTNKVIFLGIDDGMVRDPAVADLLKQANIPFTMFLVQGEAEAGADYFRQLQQYGGVVESHTINHPDLTKLSYGNMQTEVCGTLDDYQNLFGRRPTLFRPPYGSYNANVQAVAASCGFKAVVLWEGSTNDGRFDLQDGAQLMPGDIVLMHFRTDLLEDLQKVFDVCKQQGFAIASLEDYLPPEPGLLRCAVAWSARTPAAGSSRQTLGLHVDVELDLVAVRILDVQRVGDRVVRRPDDRSRPPPAARRARRAARRRSSPIFSPRWYRPIRRPEGIGVASAPTSMSSSSWCVRPTENAAAPGIARPNSGNPRMSP